MILELITPLMLATSPVTIQGPEQIYSHQEQQVVSYGDNGSKTIVWAYSTRTYNAGGQPMDSDQDQN